MLLVDFASLNFSIYSNGPHFTLPQWIPHMNYYCMCCVKKQILPFGCSELPPHTVLCTTFGN